jgi:RNA polymerase sigma-70 factor (family 1)
LWLLLNIFFKLEAEEGKFKKGPKAKTNKMTTYSSYSDQELAALLKAGDAYAYTEIYDRYKALLYRHAYKKLGDAAEAGDVMQDIFLMLWNRREYLREGENLSGYLYTAVRNKILNIFAQKKVRSHYEDSVLQYSLHHEAVTDHLVREHELAERIAKEINALPEKMREVFVLSRQRYLKNKEIAELLGLSEHTVATQLKRALKQLRIRLGLMVYIALILQSREPEHAGRKIATEKITDACVMTRR